MKIAMYANFFGMVAKVGVEETAKFAVEHGFNGVEALCGAASPGPIPDVKAAEEARKILDAYGLPMVCYSVGANIYEDKDVVAHLCQKADLAYAHGSPFLHHTMIPGLLPVDDPDYMNKLKDACDVAEKVANYAEKLGITCIYEDQGQYLNGVEKFGIFFGEMKKRCANVGVCADFGNILFVNEEPEDFIGKFIADVKHVHIKDYLRKHTKLCPGKQWRQLADDNWIRNTMVGHGVIDYEACMKLLLDNGYDGYYALEIGHPEPFEEGIAQSFEYLGHFLK